MVNTVVPVWELRVEEERVRNLSQVPELGMKK